MKSPHDIQLHIPNPTFDSYVCQARTTFSQLIHKFWISNKGIVILYFGFLVLYPIQNFLIPHMFSLMYGKIHERAPMKMLLSLIIIFTLFLQVVWVFAEYVDVRFQPKIQKFVCDEIIDQVFTVNKGNFNEEHVSHVVGLISKLPNIFYSYISQIKSVIIPSLLGLLVSAIYLIYLNCVVGLVFICTVFIAFLLVRFSLNNCDNLSFKCDKSSSSFSTHIDDILNNLQTILNFDQAEEEMKIISQKFFQYRQDCNKTFDCSLRVKYSVIPLLGLFVIFSIAWSYSIFIRDEMDGRHFVAMVMTIFLVIRLVLTLTGEMKNFIFRAGIVKSSMDIFEHCYRQREKSESGNGSYTIINGEEIDEEHASPMNEGIVFENVSFDRIVREKINNLDYLNSSPSSSSHPPTKVKLILKDLNIHFPKGKTTLIVGEIGSGKSSILNLIMRDQTISAGRIYIDGKNIDSFEHLHDRVFLVPQMPRLFDRSVYENIIYGLKEDSKPRREDVIQKMRHIGLGKFVDSLSNGLDTKVGYLGSHLSGGQRQMIWITKGFFMDSDYVLLDEPTSAVDEVSKDIIVRLLENLIKTKTVIMVTHDKFLIQFADKVVKLDDGKVVESEEDT